jgi:ABC-type glycerol-3-phosphate transport system substrate-binding protein
MNLSSLTTTNRLFYIVAAFMAVVIGITVLLIFRNLGNSGNTDEFQGQSVEVWAVFDDASAYRDIMKMFEDKYDGARVNFKRFTYEEYEKNLINELAAGKGPDVFMIHHTWLPKHADKIIPMPEKLSTTGKPLMTETDFNNQYVEVAASDLVRNGKIYGIPLYVDTLGLYYNRDLFNASGIPTPPRTWEDFNIAVETITQLDASGNIIKPAAAMGTAANVNRGTDILMALMIQTGTKMISNSGENAVFDSPVGSVKAGETALEYYTDFANPRKRVYTWSPSQSYSIDSFVQGEVAMMLNYSHQARVLREKNPRLNFAVAPMPQVNPNDARTYANYWALAVSSRAKNPELSWGFAALAGSKEGALAYLSDTLRPSARRDLITLQKDDADLGIFATQSLTAKSWTQPDNVAIEKIFTDMIEDINFGRATFDAALRSAASRVNILLKDKKI